MIDLFNLYIFYSYILASLIFITYTVFIKNNQDICEKTPQNANFLYFHKFSKKIKFLEYYKFYLEKFLIWIKLNIDEPFSLNSLKFCLIISLSYPEIFLILSWLLSDGGGDLFGIFVIPRPDWVPWSDGVHKWFFSIVIILAVTIELCMFEGQTSLNANIFNRIELLKEDSKYYKIENHFGNLIYLKSFVIRCWCLIYIF